MCEGVFTEDCGKFSQHCQECKGLGKCIGDYREAHCFDCNKHYFTGMSGFPCPCRENRRGRGGFGGVFGAFFGGMSEDEEDDYSDY